VGDVGLYEVGTALLFIALLLALFSYSDKVGEEDHPPPLPPTVDSEADDDETRDL